ncbi:Haloacid dehalogenase-like hydrolase [Popillia japonica]|uniref:Haloacid dehalogenase-like hydrolase n=1 Tax=Popillia japonica TaxID=7064 RepID=A0AAW1N3W9_POPJA
MKKSLLGGILLRRCKRKYTLKLYHPVTHCIFDLDGTLLDTDSIYAKIYKNMLEENGKTLTPDILRIISRMTNENSWKTSVKQLELNVSWKTLAEEYEKRSYQHLANCELMPGVKKLLLHLHSNKIPMAIASSTTQHLYARKSVSHKELFKLFHHVVCGRSDPAVAEINKSVSHKELFKLFHHVVCGRSDPAVAEIKPHPDVFTVCIERFEEKLKPSDCLVFENTIDGVSAAIDAGAQCVAVPTREAPKKQFRHATLILNSLEEFKPEQFGLPEYKKEKIKF